ncbi:MAG: hypothetical protein AVDCRST_MAG49-1916 [uncultured Thermomicrobiales bacterium]|uniref:Uncharacterized protein n=1 Tax=uncultured Thermomicrobiales bacterium TaxID=1645740 RepID=A0A6J4UP27_9BACT|nr:MAG: hypothetical protein AVDCRST_MAG49-1916 [uncultured Thermomicrobiales bacterium]
MAGTDRPPSPMATRINPSGRGRPRGVGDGAWGTPPTASRPYSSRTSGTTPAAALAGATLAMDATGVGRPVIDMLRAAPRRAGVAVLLPPVTITGGTDVTDHGRATGVPKGDPVSTRQVLLQDGRPRIAEGMPGAAQPQRELLAFRAKITTAGNDTYGAWATTTPWSWPRRSGAGKACRDRPQLAAW